MKDISLIPIEDLVKEIIERSETCVIGYTRKEEIGPPFIYINHNVNNSWLSAVGLCDAIKNEIIKIYAKDTPDEGEVM